MHTNTAPLVVQTVGVTFTAMAALAAAVSARAASRTAARADDTARRSVEALGRTIAPDFRAERLVEPPGLQSSADALPQFALITLNLGQHAGAITSVHVVRTDGRPGLACDGVRWPVGPTLDPIQGFKLGAMERHQPDPTGVPSSTRETFGAVRVRYSDAQGLVTWERGWELTEGIGWEGAEPGVCVGWPRRHGTPGARSGVADGDTVSAEHSCP